MKKISVIVPCHNSEEYLSDCWNSLKKQTIGISELECIFVDDASTDDTWKLLCAMEQEIPGSVVAVRLNENLRQGGARNAGLSYVTGKYVEFLDSDDYLESTTCERLYAYSEKYGADLIQFNHFNEYRDHREPVRNGTENACYQICTKDERKLLLSSGLLTTGHWNKLYRKELIERTGVRFAERCVFEEPLFVYPLFFEAETVVILDEFLYHCRIHAGSTMQRAAERLADHPAVQWRLYESLRERGLTECYADEIEFYIVWTYWIETLVNAGRGGILPYEDFTVMQRNISETFPRCAENVYLKEQGGATEKILTGIGKRIATQEELDAYTRDISALFDAG